MAIFPGLGLSWIFTFLPFRFINIANSPCQGLGSPNFQTQAHNKIWSERMHVPTQQSNKVVSVFPLKKTWDITEIKWSRLPSQTGKCPLYGCMGTPMLAALILCALIMSLVIWLHKCYFRMIPVSFWIWNKGIRSELKIYVSNTLIFLISKILNTSHHNPCDVF